MKTRMNLESIPFPAMLAAGLVLSGAAMAGAREVGGWIGAAYAQREIAAGRAQQPMRRAPDPAHAAPYTLQTTDLSATQMQRH
jgi:hypothetical protein